MKYPKFIFRNFISRRKLNDNFKLLMQKDCRYCTSTDCIGGCSSLLLQTKFELLELRGGRSDVLNDTLQIISEPAYTDAEFVEKAPAPADPAESKKQQSEQSEQIDKKPADERADGQKSEPFDLEKLQEALKQQKAKKDGDK